jgi:hypothetical protein
MKTTEELQKELDALIAEEIECQKIIEQAKKCEARLRELNRYWRDAGEIDIKKQEIEDSKFPIFFTGGWRNERIVNVDDKWISLKFDGINMGVTRYKLSNGWRERRRDDSYAIDVNKAIAIWENWKYKK